jgi:hypothetical protein
MKKILFLLLFLAFIFILLPKNAYAANLNAECQTSTGCKLTGDNPLFSKTLDGVWYPGRTVTKTINLKNIESIQKKIYLKPKENLNADLKQVMSLTITNSEGNLIWSGSLADFYNQVINLGNFDTNLNKVITIEVTMDSNADNKYQNLESEFNLSLGFNEENSNSNSNSDSQNESANSSGSSSSSSGDSASSLVSAAVEKINQYVPFIGVNEKSDLDQDKSTPQKEVLGKKVIVSACSYIWTPFIVGLFLSLLLIVIFIKKIRLTYRKYLPLIAGLSWFIIFVIANKDCGISQLFFSNSIFSNFIFYDIFLVLISYILIINRHRVKTNIYK